MGGGPGVPTPGTKAGGFGEDAIAAIGDLTELGDGCSQVVLFGSVAPRSAVQSAVRSCSGVAML
jgi:hypothetical protein